jgi:hypothetical protein
MKAYAWNQPKTAVEAHVRWTTALYGPDGTEIYAPAFVSRWELADQRAKFARLAAKGFALKLERHVYFSRVEVCYYCQARPRAIDYDIDGAYRTATCDSEQCQRGSNPDNSDWVAGTGPLWGPGHPEWDRMEAEGAPCDVLFCILNRGHVATLEQSEDRHIDATGTVFARSGEIITTSHDALTD